MTAKRSILLSSWAAAAGLAIALCLTTSVRAQDAVALDKVINQTLHSTVLNEDRVVQIYLPAGYKPTEKYDVVYVLDGEMLVRFFPPVRAFDEENDLIPPVIIVGINNVYWYDKGLNSRDRDLLPAKVSGSPLSGGADAFATFLSTELIPYINRTYASTGSATLFGHSYGGMFTMYAFLTHPEMFDHYIASDPALWWNDGYVNRIASTKLKTFPHNRKTLFIGGRAGGMYEAFGIRQMVSDLQAEAPESLRWKQMAYDDEDHGTVRLKNIYDGLKFSYFGHSGSMIDVFPRNGILLKGKPVAILNYSTYLKETPGIRYTTDGSDPTPKSPRYEYGVKVSAPARLTVKQFSNWGPDKTVTGSFTVGKAFATMTLPSGYAAGGLRYDLYSTSEFAGVPQASGRSGGGVDVNGLGGHDAFAVRFDGAFSATSEGYYTFFVDCDAAARLVIDGTTLIDADMARDKMCSTSFVVPLKAGFHALRLDYVHRTGDPYLSLTYLPPAKSDPLAHLPIAIPDEQLFSMAP